MNKMSTNENAFEFYVNRKKNYAGTHIFLFLLSSFNFPKSFFLQFWPNQSTFNRSPPQNSPSRAATVHGKSERLEIADKQRSRAAIAGPAFLRRFQDAAPGDTRTRGGRPWKRAGKVERRNLDHDRCQSQGGEITARRHKETLKRTCSRMHTCAFIHM